MMVAQDLLKSHQVLCSRSLSAMHERLARDYCSHSLYRLGRGSTEDAEFRRAYVNRLSFNFLHYGADVGIEAGSFETFYMVELPLAGCASISYGSSAIESREHLGVVLSPIRPVRSTWTADCSRLMIQIPRARLESHLVEFLGVNLRSPLEFQVPLDTSTRNGAALRRMLIDLAGQIDIGPELSEIPFFPGQCERLVMTALLSLQPHNYSEALTVAAEVRPCSPGFVRRAQAYISDHFCEDISVDQIAVAAGVSTRSLFSGFKRYVGASPMSLLKQRRLQAAHDELLVPDSPKSVRAIAHRWGFTHLGRFAQEYRQRFGEAPSGTLRRS
jgi:AraC-like DNA-binding protein